MSYVPTISIHAKLSAVLSDAKYSNYYATADPLLKALEFSQLQFHSKEIYMIE